MNESVAKSGAADDMGDWPHGLSPEAQVLQLEIQQAYDRSDKLAGRYQFRHRAATLAAAVFGTAAVCAAIYQLYESSSGQHAPLARFAEAGLAAVAFIAVSAGLYMAFMRSWLLERHRAERLRLLKYRLLLSDFLAASGARPGLGLADAYASLDEIEKLDEDGLEVWLDANSRTLSFGDIERSMGPALEELSRHYLRTRLRIHETFFHRKARKQELIDEFTKHLPALCFFASILFAFIHFGLEFFDAGKGASHVLLFCTAISPVLGAGIRTWRGTHEFARNALRYGGYHLAVHEVTESLRAELEKEQPNPYVLLDGMARGEHLFEDEHREWLRLTKEVEWFA